MPLPLELIMSNSLKLNNTFESLPAVFAPSHIPLETWKILMAHGQRTILRNKQILFKTGHPARRAAILVCGFLILRKGDTIIDVLGSGESVAGILIGDKDQTISYPIDTQALGVCEVLEIQSSDIMNLFKLHDEISSYFHEQFRKRMHHLQTCRIFQNQAVANRIAHFLITKKELLQSQLLTRKLIAQATSSTTETVIRTLLDWQKKGIIKIYRKKLEILEPSYLESLCAILQN